MKIADDITYGTVWSRHRTADVVIERDGRVLVRAPKSLGERRIRDLIKRKHFWIYKNLAEWRDLNATRGKTDVRELRHRWASCSPKGNLAFRWKCMMAPPTIIGYIIVPELCHFHHLDHTGMKWARSCPTTKSGRIGSE